MSRVKSAYKNSGAVLLYQCSSVILAFVGRKIFIQMLGVAFLGYNAVFTNILSALNLTELGIGFAITSLLYKPLAQHEEQRVKTLIYMYRKIYQVIGVLVAIVGIAVSFVLPYLVKDASHSMDYIRVLFFINLVGTVTTYFLSYHRTVLIANQENYITAFLDMGLNIFLTLLQILGLYFVPRYEIYLILEVLKSFLGNVLVTILCRRRYPYLKGKPEAHLLAEYKVSVMRFVKDAFAAKMGAYVFYGTDNIIIAYFKGSILTGFLSNYTMIVNTVQIVVVQMLASVQSVIGNYVFSVKDKKQEKEMSENYLFLNYFIGNFAMVCIVFLIQPFITMFFGPKFQLPNSTAMLLGINLMLTIISQMPSQLFSIYQLFGYDKYIVSVSAILNIILSVGLVRPFGIDGVLIGTFVTSLIYIFSRIYIIWKKVFQSPVRSAYKRILFYGFGSIINLFIAFYITGFFLADNVVNFIMKVLLVGSSAVLVPAVIFGRTKEEKFFINIMRGFLK